jgi:hypothetical protein
LADALRRAQAAGELPQHPTLSAILSHLEDAARIDAERAEGGRAARAAESLRIREGILRAAGALPRSRGVVAAVLRRIEMRGPEFYGLRRVPDRGVVAETLQSGIASPHMAVTSAGRLSTTLASTH